MTDFALQREMHETPDLLRRFDATRVLAWRPVLKRAKRILLTGEGSSRIFPAHNLIAQGLQRGTGQTFITAGGREALAYDLRDTVVIGVSNSGRTRELLDLFTHAQAQGVPCLAVTATPDSPLTRIADDTLVLSCGPEQAIAASKSVFEQALVFQSLLEGDEWPHAHAAADHCAAVLHQAVPHTLIETLAGARHVYIAGRNDGVAEELVLKTTEILRKPATYLEGTYLLHGVEEVLQPDDVVLLIAPFAQDFAKIQQVIAQGTGSSVLAIAADETPFSTLRVPSIAAFDAYVRLLAGWTVLVRAALHNTLDLDTARRARKSGNAL